MEDITLEKLVKWYELLGHEDPKSAAAFEFDNDTNLHSMMLFLKGAWKEISSAVEDKEIQHEALFAICYYLSDQSNYFKDLDIDEKDHKEWAVFEIDKDGNPIKRLDGLHYHMEDCG